VAEGVGQAEIEKPALTVNDKDFSSAIPDASTIRMVNGKVPVCTGRPEIPPVAAFNVSPGGRAPPLMAHVYGSVPPVAATVSE